MKEEDLVKDVVRQLMNNKEFVELSDRIGKLAEEIAKIAEKQVEIMSDVLMVPKDMLVDLFVSYVLEAVTIALVRKFGEDVVAEGTVDWLRTKVDREAFNRFLRAYEETARAIEELKEEGEIDG